MSAAKPNILGDAVTLGFACGSTQPTRDFARRIGVPVDTVRNWEQGKRSPQGPARALLRIIDRSPELALKALEES